MPKIIIDGIKTNYLAFGNVGDNKPTIVFIHGAAQSISTWQYQLELCKSTTRFTSVVPDLPGHGKSDGFGTP